MKRFLLAIGMLPAILAAQQADQTLQQSINRIAFGSCSVSKKVDAQMWKEVNQTNPDLWIWLGDNIYGDTEDMSVLREKYDRQKSHPDYQQLLSKTKVIGIWDDHDFGVNDGGKGYPMKVESKSEMFRFLDLDQSHPARSREGAHQSYSFSDGPKTIKVILLDARYFRDPLKKDENNINIPNPDGEILGENQWKWLARQLDDKNADLFIIGSGIQVIPEEHRFEKWANFPTERTRLFNTIKDHVKTPLVFISGDRHISEVSSMELTGYRYPLIEFTSSSLTNPWGKPRDEANRYRNKEIVFDQNFASMTIVWTAKELTLTVEFITKENEVIQSHVITYDL